MSQPFRCRYIRYCINKGGYEGGTGINLGLNKIKAPSLLASSFQKLFLKNLSEAGIQLTLMLSKCMCFRPLRALDGASREQSRNWDPSGACGYPAHPPSCLTTGPADPKAVCKVSVQTSAGHSHQFKNAWRISPTPAPACRVFF